MKSIGKALSRSLLTLAAAGLGLASTPRTAAADTIVTFQVDENVVPDSSGLACGIFDCTFDADKIAGLYDETLTISPTFDFDVSALGFLTSYGLGGGPAGTGLVGLAEPLGYDLFAVFTGSGNVDPISGDLTFSSATVTLYIDPDQDNTYTAPGDGSTPYGITDPGTFAADEEVLSSSTLLAGGGGVDPALGGFFDLTFTDLIFTAFGDTYFPGLSALSLLFGTVDGDFDDIPSPPVPGTYFPRGGEFSVVMSVPEPATLSLLGFGLLGSGFAVRRRRRAARQV